MFWPTLMVLMVAVVLAVGVGWRPVSRTYAIPRLRAALDPAGVAVRRGCTE